MFFKTFSYMDSFSTPSKKYVANFCASVFTCEQSIYQRRILMTKQKSLSHSSYSKYIDANHIQAVMSKIFEHTPLTTTTVSHFLFALISSIESVFLFPWSSFHIPNILRSISAKDHFFPVGWRVSGIWTGTVGILSVAQTLNEVHRDGEQSMRAG